MTSEGDARPDRPDPATEAGPSSADPQAPPRPVTSAPVPTPAAPRDPFSADRREEDAAQDLDRSRSTGGPPFQWPLSLVLVGLVASLVIVATDHFRRGAVLFSLFVLLAFVLRMVLSERHAGWLAVRTRAIDLTYLGVLGASVTVLAFSVPPPS